jgi:carboxyl-terminal processing protease
MRRAAPSSWIAIVLICALVAVAPAPTVGATPDGSLVVEALQVLEREYHSSVDVTKLLNAAVGSLRKATGAAADILPDIPPGLPATDQFTAFLAQFALAARRGALSEADLAAQTTREMLASLNDTHVRYLNAAQYDEIKNQQAGRPAYTGIGVRIVVRQGEDGANWPYAFEVYSDSPAAAGGLQRFDKILQVDGRSVRDAAAGSVSDMIRGPAGSTVTMMVRRGGRTLTVRVVRAPIQAPLVRQELIRPGVAYVKLLDFQQGAANEVRNALRSLATQQEIRGVVLDLRGNPGGLLREAELTAGTFLPHETILVRTMRRSEAPGTYVARGEPMMLEVPLVVLVDDRTASSSEVVTIGLRDAHRATIVGERTAGALGASRTFPLSVGAVVVTVARVVGPSQEIIEHEGIAPDIPVKLTGTDMEQGRDAQLEAALKALGAAVVRWLRRAA